MLDTLRNLDWHTVQTLVQYGQSHLWFARTATFCAEILILLFIPILYVIWHLSQPASKHMSNKKAVVLALLGLVFAVAIKTLIAMVWLRARPFVSHPDLLIAASRLDPQSFPSGHTLVAATLTFCLWMSGMRKLGWFLLVLTILIAFGRVATGVHYPSDVLAGLAIGCITAWVLHHESSSIKRYLPNE